jgi:hypothetical protein
MNRRTLLTVVLLLVLSGVAALAGGRRLSEVARTQDPVILDATAVQSSADGEPVAPLHVAIPVAVAE